MNHTEQRLIQKMRTIPTVEGLRDFWTNNLGNSFKSNKIIQSEKDRLKDILPSQKSLETTIQAIGKIKTKKALKIYTMEMDKGMLRHRDVRRAVVRRIKEMKQPH
jgi:hypothetical protein